MAALNKYKDHSQFTGPTEVVEIQYDFAKDGGATGALDILKVKQDMVLVDAYLKVDTTFTSGGSATLIWGTSGTTNLCLNTTNGAVANLTSAAGVVKGDSACKQVKVAANTVFQMTIGTAAMTAGKARFVMIFQKF
jgi:hypothetical protein